ncbi:hypothetical protein BAUCODRAFT_230797 [Baudoinia panamericana UAMH 10762]|uniref:Efficient mitochondria targeting-associated protein 19 n=1 Tax=Baudoinia panamericana (strain UAMH 10762) TaxID=717646 RepID=M2MP10_BAUPA|nr:uncharacterized protein BAUCODRAFT_230797 [Baudoinia panamericana UAMH 10762]EMC93208.1 hypothetical protein BAUCODRAFT_230797 [Baudoinia panamericana UAMH 10762]
MAPITSRWRDIIYLIFFTIHIPVMFCVDLYPLYPTSLRPAFLDNIRRFYIETYYDQNFVTPAAWFTLYMWMEFLYHVPLSVWAIGALLRDDSKLPIHLLIFAVQTAITTSTCIADYLSWSTISSAQKVELGKLYVPYLALSVFMGVDMYARLNAALGPRITSNAGKKAA